MPVIPVQGGNNNTWGTDLNAWLEADHQIDGTHLALSTSPVSVGPWPQDESGWTIGLIGPRAHPALDGIPNAPALTVLANTNKLHLPSSIANLSESPPTTLQAQINATASGGICRVTRGYIYREAITISNAITIIGHGQASLRSSDDWTTGGVPGNTWSGAGPYTSSLSIPAMALDAIQGTPTNPFCTQHREGVFSDGVLVQLVNSATPSAGQWALGGTPKTITAVAAASGGNTHFTATAHGMSTGNTANVYSVGGAVELNGAWTVTVIDANTLSVPLAAHTAYTSGGTADAGRKVIMGTNPSGHKIEVNTRNPIVSINTTGAVVIDGLDIRHTAGGSAGNASWVFNSTPTSMQLLNCMIGWAHASGFATYIQPNFLAEYCIFHSCGTVGIGGTSNVNDQYVSCLMFNNGLAAIGYDPSWGSGACKFTGATGTLIERCVAFANNAFGGGGLWYDILCVDCAFLDNVSWDNSGNQIRYEVSSFGSIRGNVCFRSASLPWTVTEWTAGITLANSRWVDVTNNLIMHCPLGLALQWLPSRSDSPPSGTTDNTHRGGLTYHDNNIIGKYHDTNFNSGLSHQVLWFNDDGTGTYCGAASNIGQRNVFGFPSLLNSGGSFLEVQQEPDQRWTYPGNVGITSLATANSTSSGQFGGSGVNVSTYMTDATRVAYLRKFGLIP